MSKIFAVFSFILFANFSFGADFFWIGGTGNWSDVNHWSATSGGASVGAIPTNIDNAIFDNLSGLAGVGDIVTMDVAVVVNDFDFSILGNAFTLTSALPSIEIQGSLLANGLSTIAWNGDINMNSTVAGNNILSNGTNWDNDFHVIGTEPITLSDLFSNNRDFYVDNGGLNAVGITFLCLNFYSNTTNTRTIDFSSSTLSIGGTDWIIDPTSLTMDMIVSFLTLWNTGTINFDGGDQAYSNVISSAATLIVSGNNSFERASLSASSILTLANGSTQQLDSLETSGSCGANTTINTVNPLMAAASIEKTGYNTFVSNSLSIENVDAVTGGGQSYLISLSDTTASDNWTYSGTTYYWIGGSGNWSDLNNWSFTSGGAVAGCLPDSEDSVYFDNNSFITATDVVTVDQDSYFGYMDWSSSTGTPNLELDFDLYANGSIVLQPNMTITRTALFRKIEFIRTAQFDPVNASIDCYLSVNMTDDSHQVDLQSTLNMSDTSLVLIAQGGLFSNGETIYTGTIQVVDLAIPLNKALDLTGSIVELKISFISEAVSNFTFNAPNSDILIGDPVRFNSLVTDGIAFHDVTLDYDDLGTTQQISGDNSFNKLSILKGTTAYMDTASVQTILDSLIIVGNCNDSISIFGYDITQPGSFDIATTAKAIVECVNLRAINSDNALINADYSTDLGNNGANWDFSIASPTTAGFTDIGPDCFGDTTFFTNTTTVVTGNSSDYTSSWDYNDGSGTFIDTLSHAFLLGGDIDVTLTTEFTNFCTNSVTQTVHINNPDVFLSTSENDTTICIGDEVSFSAFSSIPTGITFDYFVNGVSQGTTISTFVTSGLNHLDTVSIISEENGCFSPTEPEYIFVVHDLPVFNWTSSDADTAICLGENVDFSAFSAEPSDEYRYLVNGSIEYGYDPAGNYSTTSLANLDIVEVVGLDTNGCSDTLFMNFTVHPLPATTLAESTGGNLICDGADVTFTASGAATYEFFVDGASQGAPGSNVWMTNTLTTGQVVSVVGYSVEGCSFGAPETYSYTVNPLPNITISILPNTTTICSGDNVNITTSGGSLYEMFINSVSQGAPAPISSYNLTTLNDDDTVYIEGGFSGCTNQSDSLIFEVFTSPTTTLVSDDADQTICSEDQVIFTASGANNYEFFVDGVSQGPSSPTNTYVSSSLLNGQTVTVNGESNTCILSQGIGFTVLPIPSVGIFSDDADNTICEGELITFTGSNANSYELFINGVSQGAPQGSPSFPEILGAGNNSVYVIGTAGNGCSDTSSTAIDVLVNAIPTVVVTSSDIDNIICQGESVTFTGTGSDMYQFFLDGISQGSLSATDTYVNSNLSDGAVITAFGSTQGCTNTSNAVNITVNAIPAIALNSSDVDNVFCEDDLVNFTATGGINYEFFVDGVSQGASSPIDVINSAGFTSGNYTIDVIGEANNCINNSSLSVTVYGLPTASLVSSDIDNVICSSESVTYTAAGGSLYEFFVNGVSQGPTSPLDNIVLTSLSDGDVVSVNVTNVTGCDDISTFAPITVNSTPTVNIASSDIDLEICVGDNVTFTGSGSTNYEFFVNGISQSPSSPSNTLSIPNLNNGDVVSIEGSTLGCYSSSADLTFIVHDYPTVGLVNNNDVELCTGELTDLVASGGNNYQFLINGIPTGGFTPTATFNSALNDGDVVSVIGELNGCQSTALSTFTYTVFTYPNLVSSVSPGTTICLNDQVTVNGTGGLTYSFELNGVTVQNGALNDYISSDLVDGDVINVTTLNGDCASAIDSYTFNVNSMNLDLTIMASNLICEGENVTFTATGGNQYEFFLNGVSQGPMSATSSFSSSTLNDLDEITFNAYSASTGCVQEYGDFTIMNVIEEPLITPLSSTQFCEGDSVILVSNAPYGNQWYLDGSPIAGATDTSYVVYGTGAYSLDVTGGGDGDVWSFGHNSYGNFGSGNNLNNSEPTMAITTEVFDELSSGYHFVLAVTQTGQLYSWGDNEFGQLGDGTYSDENLPMQVPTLSNIKTVATSETSSMAVTNSGELYVWGNNDEGQLATGNTSVINFPFLNAGVIDVDSIAGGRNHFVFLKTDGTVWAVGNNDYGQLGQGNLIGSMSAIQVAGLSNVVSVGAGEYNSFAIDNAGDLYVWGNNGSGQLGLNDLTNRLDPTLSPLKNVINAQGGATHSLFLTSTKKVFSTGGNAFGQLGSSNYISSTVAAEVPVTGAVSISAGEYTSLIRREDNTVYGFGNNTDDQLSAPVGILIPTPELIPDAEGVTFVEASLGTSHFIFGDGQTCTSQPINTNLLTAPPVNIYVNADTLSTDFGSSYQWYLDGNPIPGANSQTYEATTSGNFTVAVTYANGCTNTSDVHIHSMTSIDYLSLGSVQLYPNPADLGVNIAFSTLLNGRVDIAIIDQSGRIVHSSNFSDVMFLTLDIAHLENGIYQVMITNEQVSGALRFVKNSK